jgi:hypothetical protein
MIESYLEKSCEFHKKPQKNQAKCIGPIGSGEGEY